MCLEKVLAVVADLLQAKSASKLYDYRLCAGAVPDTLYWGTSARRTAKRCSKNTTDENDKHDQSMQGFAQAR